MPASTQGYSIVLELDATVVNAIVSAQLAAQMVATSGRRIPITQAFIEPPASGIPLGFGFVTLENWWIDVGLSTTRTDRIHARINCSINVYRTGGIFSGTIANASIRRDVALAVQNVLIPGAPPTPAVQLIGVPQTAGSAITIAFPNDTSLVAAGNALNVLTCHRPHESA